MTRRPTISRALFDSLRHGDVVRWRKFRYRTVVLGPADFKVGRGIGSIYFPINVRSWTGRAHTSYGYNDVKNIIEYTGRKSKFVFSKDEAFRLLNAGFDIRKEVERDMGADPTGLMGGSFPDRLKCKSTVRIEKAR